MFLLPAALVQFLSASISEKMVLLYLALDQEYLPLEYKSPGGNLLIFTPKTPESKKKRK